MKPNIYTQLDQRLQEWLSNHDVFVRDYPVGYAVEKLIDGKFIVQDICINREDAFISAIEMIHRGDDD